MPTAPTSKPDDGRRDTLPQPPPRAGACPGPRHHEADNSRATKTGQLDELATDLTIRLVVPDSLGAGRRRGRRTAPAPRRSRDWVDPWVVRMAGGWESPY